MMYPIYATAYQPKHLAPGYYIPSFRTITRKFRSAPWRPYKGHRIAPHGTHPLTCIYKAFGTITLSLVMILAAVVVTSQSRETSSLPITVVHQPRAQVNLLSATSLPSEIPIASHEPDFTQAESLVASSESAEIILVSSSDSAELISAVASDSAEATFAITTSDSTEAALTITEPDFIESAPATAALNSIGVTPAATSLDPADFVPATAPSETASVLASSPLFQNIASFPYTTTAELAALGSLVDTPIRYVNPIAYTGDDLLLLARIIDREAGSDWLTDIHQLLVGNVVLNRLLSVEFPDNIVDIVFAPKAYGPDLAAEHLELKTPSDRAIRNARRLLEGERFCPDSVVFQANDEQGKGIFLAIYDATLDTTTYFCYANHMQKYAD